MKVLLVADLHYTLPQFDWLQREVTSYDVVVIAGDLLDLASPVPVAAQVVVVTKLIAALGQRTRLLVCSGNHDLTGRGAAGDKSPLWLEQVRGLGIPCDGERIVCGSWLLSICPWWDGDATKDDVARQLRDDARSLATTPRTWVWVYHAPPAGSATCWTGRGHAGDDALADWIRLYRPFAVLCGHIHNAPFLGAGSWVDRLETTWVFNPGRQPGAVPCHIVIDTGSGRISWHSLQGEDSRTLSA
jgi:Icc-related predicted phosphoesterase